MTACRSGHHAMIVQPAIKGVQVGGLHRPMPHEDQLQPLYGQALYLASAPVLHTPGTACPSFLCSQCSTLYSSVCAASACDPHEACWTNCHGPVCSNWCILVRAVLTSACELGFLVVCALAGSRTLFLTEAAASILARWKAPLFSAAHAVTPCAVCLLHAC